MPRRKPKPSIVPWTSRLRNMRRTAWFFRPRSALSRVVLKLRTSTARWLVTCSPHSSTLPSMYPPCGGEAMRLSPRVASDAPLWLSSVVLEELYAGAGNRERRVVERLERDFDRVKRILVERHTGDYRR